MHEFNWTLYQQLFPALVGYGEASAQAWWNIAADYLGTTDNPWGLNGAQLDNALAMLTAHLQYSANILTSGEGAPVIIASATIDKVTITTKPPEARNNWRYWLLTTPYGQQLLALLEMLAAGGWSVGGLPERTGFRKIGGTFI